ncbi:hypothetical protein QZH41_004751 [Actinostola sp. cb2023]|nr:hypothetical protein QZH41_004751 [Actinostola sp. cb2023]
MYANTLRGASNTVEFLNFFYEASQFTQPDGNPILEYGDIIVADNAAFHRFDGGQILAEWLDSFGITLIYLPVYSPELTPVELVFNKLKTVLHSDISNNSLTEIPSWIFPRRPNFTRLSLANNHITIIKENAFKITPFLQYMKLFYIEYILGAIGFALNLTVTLTIILSRTLHKPSFIMLIGDRSKRSSSSSVIIIIIIIVIIDVIIDVVVVIIIIIISVTISVVVVIIIIIIFIIIIIIIIVIIIIIIIVITIIIIVCTRTMTMTRFMRDF